MTPLVFISDADYWVGRRENQRRQIASLKEIGFSTMSLSKGDARDELIRVKSVCVDHASAVFGVVTCRP